MVSGAPSHLSAVRQLPTDHSSQPPELVSCTSNTFRTLLSHANQHAACILDQSYLPACLPVSSSCAGAPPMDKRKWHQVHDAAVLVIPSGLPASHGRYKPDVDSYLKAYLLNPSSALAICGPHTCSRACSSGMHPLRAATWAQVMPPLPTCLPALNMSQIQGATSTQGAGGLKRSTSHRPAVSQAVCISYSWQHVGPASFSHSASSD